MYQILYLYVFYYLIIIIFILTLSFLCSNFVTHTNETCPKKLCKKHLPLVKTSQIGVEFQELIVRRLISWYNSESRTDIFVWLTEAPLETDL